MGLDPFGDGVEHRWVVVLRPFGVQPDDMLGAQPGAALGQGVDVFGDRFRTVDDELVLIGSGDVVGQWQLPALGAEGDPVECAADRKGTASFEVGLLAHRVQCGSERAEIVDGRFAASDHGKLGAGVGDLGREGRGLEPVNVLGDVVRVPGASGVAPRAMHGTAKSADEVSGSTCVRTLALESIKLFVDREHLERLEG